MKKNKILIFISNYLPGYKSGGPVRTIENLVNNLSDYFNFYIITSDRDLGDSTPYTNIEYNVWNKVGNAQVMYLSGQQKNIATYIEILKKEDFSVIYFNSFFNYNFTIKPLLALKKSKNNTPCLLAPKGEFSQGALQLKSFKKKVFLKLSKPLYKNLYFHASSEYEKNDILCSLPFISTNKVHKAIDLPQKNNFVPSINTNNSSFDIKIIFLSRISPMKNLDYALNCLKQVTKNICFDIYGPIEDQQYWEKCEEKIKDLPKNITCRYKGIIEPKDILQTFSKYDLFFFPTKGENYGHVIAEALAAGTQVLLSDQTPWRNLTSYKVGWDLPLNKPQNFSDIINQLKPMSINEKIRLIENAQPLLINEKDIEANKNLFMQITNIKNS